MPVAAYTGDFTVGATVAGFDIRTSAYSEDTAANMTVRPVPYAPTYTVVVQVRGFQPRQRRYRCLLYLEADYARLSSLVGQAGILTTPREPAPLPPGTQNAVLTAVRRGEFQNPSNSDGEQTVELEFVMLV